ncbi:ABC-2 type transporter [Paenibacillus algorifonticola]|uniref:ABC-2 type transporter n=1 Tax=Paenibacillus algorifonticola TaxID=684063 RepID=A0A1I2I0G6_9BACL|nr:ABC-2 type transporter [Paenibacillus algorifonticola]
MAYRLFLDKRGIIERFHSMPIARSTVLWGHVLTSVVSNVLSVVVIILVALLMGFRSSAGVLSWLAVAGILVLFTLALTWVAAIAGLSANRSLCSFKCSRIICKKKRPFRTCKRWQETSINCFFMDLSEANIIGRNDRLPCRLLSGLKQSPVFNLAAGC